MWATIRAALLENVMVAVKVVGTAVLLAAQLVGYLVGLTAAEKAALLAYR